MCRSDMEKVDGDHGLVRMQSNGQDMITTRNAKPDDQDRHHNMLNKKPNVADADVVDNLNGVSVDDTSELPIELQQALNVSSVSEGASSLVQANSNSSGESFTSSSPHDQHLAVLGVVDQAPNYSDSTSVSTGLHPVIDNHIHSSTTFHNLLLSDDNSCTPFFLPRSAWPQNGSVAPATSETTSQFLSSSLLNSVSDHLSLVSNKSTPTFVPFDPRSFHSNQLAPGMNNNAMQFGDVGYHIVAPHYGGGGGPESDQYSTATMHPSSYSCFTTPYMHTDKMPEFGAADMNGDCSMYNTNQYLQDNDQMSYVYPAYPYNAAYPGGAASSHGMNSYPPSYALSQMDFQAGAEHPFVNASSPYLAHSGAPVSVYFDHMGIQQGVVNIADHHQSYPANMPISSSSPEGLGSSLTLAMQEDQATATNVDRCPLETGTTGAPVSANWKAQQQRSSKGHIPKSNKRASPDGEDDDQMQECSPPLKRSASWNCMSSTSTASSSPPMDHTITTVYNNNNNNANQAGPGPKPSPKQSTEKPRARQGIANDPQSIAARHRRERISERLKTLQQLVPNGSKVDLVTMLEKAINYVKFLQLQVKVLATDEYWPTPLNKFPKVANLGKLAEKDTLTKTEKNNINVECKKVDEQAAA